MVEQASGRSPAEQAADIDLPATEREVAAMDRMLIRRTAGEPLQYVLGRWAFRSLDLLVDRRVLIPRPETEWVTDIALAAVADLDELIAVDLGTGSGAIALALAAERWPGIEVWATDVSPDAIAVARANLAGLGRRASCVRLLEGSWFDPLPEGLRGRRSEEHTSELQSLMRISYAVFCWKKKKTAHTPLTPNKPVDRSV